MPPTPLRITFTLSGRPLPGATVWLTGFDDAWTTDGAGLLTVALPAGRVDGEVEVGDQRLPFTFVNASGRRDARVDLREVETPIDDARVLAAMPSDRYLPIKLLGRGAAGAVYKVRDTVLDRLVAIKLLSEEFASSEEEFDAFLGEARSLARIDHPNLIDIYDLGRHQGRVWMAVEFVDGPDLEMLTVTHRKLPSGAVAAAGVQLMRALHAIHREGFIHRDVKPSNGLVSRDGRVRLADFGLVRPMIDFTDPRSRIYGTPAYMSPEQLQARPLGPASDIYGLGATLFHMAAGRLPFDGPNPILAHLTDPAPDLAEVVPETAPELAAVLLAMMDKDPDTRPHADEVIERLVAVSTTVPWADDTAYLPRLHTSDMGSDPRVSRSAAVAAPAADTAIVRPVALSSDAFSSGAVGPASGGSAGARALGSGPLVSVDAVSVEADELPAGRSRRGLWIAALAVVLAGAVGAVVVTSTSGADAPAAAPESEASASAEAAPPSPPTGDDPAAVDGAAVAAGAPPAEPAAADDEMPDAVNEPLVVALAWRDIGAGVRAAETVARLTAGDDAPADEVAAPPTGAAAPDRSAAVDRGDDVTRTVEASAPTDDKPSRRPSGASSADPDDDAPSDAPVAAVPDDNTGGTAGSAAASDDEVEAGPDAAPVDPAPSVAAAPPDERTGETDPSSEDSAASAAADDTASSTAEPDPSAAADEPTDGEGGAEPAEDAEDDGRGRRGRQGGVRPPVTF